MKVMDKKLIAILFTLALSVRLVALALVPSPPLDASAQAAYLAGAQKLLGGEGFQDPSYPVYAPPLYGMFIAFWQTLLGGTLGPVKIVQVVVDSVTVVLIFLIMRELFNLRTGFLAAMTFAIYPFAIYLAISIASEPLVTCLLAAFVLLTIYAVKSQRLSYFAASGMVLGLATLTRGATQFVPFLFGLMLLPYMRFGKRFLMSFMIFFASCVLAISPWTIRNYIILDDFIPVATAGGIVILQGSNERYLTIPGKPEMNEKYPPPQGRKPSEVDRYWRDAGIAEHLGHFQADLMGFITFNILKFFRLWYATESGQNHHWTLGVNLPLYLLALLGLALAFKNRRMLVLIPAFIVAYFALLHWVSLPLFRYMMPVMPYVIGFASFAAVELAHRWDLFDKLRTSVAYGKSKSPTLNSDLDR